MGKKKKNYESSFHYFGYNISQDFLFYIQLLGIKLSALRKITGFDRTHPYKTGNIILSAPIFE